MAMFMKIAICLTLLLPCLMAEYACVEDGYDYQGADIGGNNFRSSGFVDCYSRCWNLPGCKSLTIRTSDNWCWLKNKDNGNTKVSGQNHLLSVNMKCASVSAGCVKENTDFRGADIAGFSGIPDVASLDDCISRCVGVEGCASVTHQPSSKNCWLKSKRYGNEQLVMTGVNSRNLICVPDECVRENTDFRGADIAGFSGIPNVGSLDDCISRCVGVEGCVSVTHQPSSSKCWLKNKKEGDGTLGMAGVNSRNLDCE